MTILNAFGGVDAVDISPQEILVEQVRLVYRMVSGAPWTMLGVSVFIVAVLHDIGPPIYIWLGVQIVLKLAVYIEMHVFFREELIAARPEYAMYRLMVTQMPQAAGWAALMLVGAHGSDIQQIFILMMMVGILGAGVTTYGGKPLIHIAYITGYVAMQGVNALLLRSVIAHNPITFYVLLLSSIYCVGIFTNTRVAGRTYRDSIILGFANARLAKRLEQEVLSTRAAQEDAEAANAAKSTFLAAASHDLRQPIHAVGLFLGVLERSKLKAEQRATLGLTRSALTSSFEMLDALLDFSRAEAGVILPRPRPFKLGQILREIEAEAAAAADEKQLVYRTRDCDAAVYSDPALVKIILLNLVSNAIRYTSEGGLLVGCRRRGGGVAVEVWDTGAGVPRAKWQSIFSDFIQLGNPERDRRKGLGLGLAIARRLARLIDSDVTLNSAVGRGSVFRFTLPLECAGADAVTESETAAEAAMGAPPGRSPLGVTQAPAGRHVLVIDDDEAIRVSLGALLRQTGYGVEAVETITEAEASARRIEPQLLICDSRLRGGESGAEAARRLRAQLGRRVPAILITGDTHPDRIAEAAREDMEILYKPAQPDVLLDLVAKLAPAI